MNSLEKKIDDTEKKYEETRKISEERLKQTLEAESKIEKMKTDMHRFLCAKPPFLSVFSNLSVSIPFQLPFCFCCFYSLCISNSFS